jgi:1-deoxy-D-xylulose 5-phosphate reductoisomerase
VVLNASNEVAIDKFKQNECNFFGMSDIVLKCYRHFDDIKPNSIEDIIRIDSEVREFAKRIN